MDSNVQNQVQKLNASWRKYITQELPILDHAAGQRGGRSVNQLLERLEPEKTTDGGRAENLHGGGFDRQEIALIARLGGG